MLLYEIFDYFDPKSGPMPDYFEDHFGFVAKRARTVLMSRNKEFILNAYDILEAMYDECGPWKMEALENDGQPDYELHKHYLEGDAQYSVAYDFVHMIIGEYDLVSEESLKHPTWPEMLAVIALAKIAEAHWNISQVSSEEQDIGHELDAIDSCGILLSEATDAIAIAEGLQYTEDMIEHIDRLDKLTSGPSRGGKKRAENYKPLRGYVISEWLERHKNISVRQAAIKIWKTVPDDLKDLISTDDPEKRLEKWIGIYKKQFNLK
ncbi:MAG: hypothetical protein OEZ10_13505 [Gammaproteobacteria bacterium]|nr:hypothetical protein [Gammaproteobacteria bacterium]